MEEKPPPPSTPETKSTVDAESFAANVLLNIKDKNKKNLITVIQDINNYNKNSSIMLQKMMEYCYQDIIGCLNQEVVDPIMDYLMWSLLSALSSLQVARKMLRKETIILPALHASLDTAVTNKNTKIQKVLSSLLSTLLIGANQVYFDMFGELGFIKLLKDIITGPTFQEDVFKSVICCFSLLCDGSLLCKQQLNEFKIAEAMLKMGQTHPLLDEDMLNLAAMTYDDLKALKMNYSIGRNKFLKSHVNDQVVCSNPKCLKPQEDVKFKKCARCKVTVYCSKECQIVHWKQEGHHKQCHDSTK